MKNRLGDGDVAVGARRGAVRRQVGRFVAVLGIVSAMVVGSAGVAMAAPFAAHKCQLKATHTICLHIREESDGRFEIVVFLAVNMSQAAARNIIDAPEADRSKFGSTLFGADFPLNTNLGPVFLDRSATTFDGGLQVNFDRGGVSRGELDEDLFATDEIFAAVRITVPSLGINMRFQTPEVSHGF